MHIMSGVKVHHTFNHILIRNMILFGHFFEKDDAFLA